MTIAPPWRRGDPAQFPGVPAWSVATALADTTVDAVDFSGIDRDWAWLGSRGAGVKVCVLDSGVDGSHPAVGTLAASHTVHEDGSDWDVIPCDPVDSAGHGTACASIIRSVAPDAEISSLRVLTDGKTGSGQALITGLRWALDTGFDVVNLSLSTSRHAYRAQLYELADAAYFQRTTLVTAANNMPVRSYPWTFASVLSVASHDLEDPMTHFYNPAPPAEFQARGVRVPVAWPGGGHLRSTGNSFAAPHVAGLCALILSKHPWLTPFQLKSVLYLTAVNIATENGGHDDHVEQR